MLLGTPFPLPIGKSEIDYACPYILFCFIYTTINGGNKICSHDNKAVQNLLLVKKIMTLK
jgi:hypothetical protein